MSTFYLKYRPQKISELDLSEIREQLYQVLSSGEIPHAFLFAGPKGLGKTSAARIVAKSINCEAKKDFEPCNKCHICKSITNGTSLDLIEIDAASNRGIDDIRELREKIKLTPSQAKKKVYVIDEAHMLTVPAFNALLKTLEEPPEHAFFILCTTEPEKLPETIISRCQRFNFRLAKPSEIVRALKRIIKGENLKVKDDVLELIARKSEKSFRDAVKTLQELSFKGKNISLKRAKDFFGTKFVLSKDILELMFKKNITGALEALNRAVEMGAGLKILTEAILEDLRRIILLKYKIGEQSLEGQDYGLEVNQVKRLIDLFDKAGRNLKGAVIPQLPLELAIIEYGESRVKNQTSKIKQEAKKTPRRWPNGLLRGGGKKETLLDKWQEVLKEVKKDNHSLEALLKSARPKKVKGKKMVIEVFYEFHKNKLEMDDYISLVEKRIEQVFGKDLKVEYVLRR